MYWFDTFIYCSMITSITSANISTVSHIHNFFFSGVKTIKISSPGSWGERMGGRDREFGMDVYTLLYLKWITNNDLLYSTWNSAQCYMAAWMGGGFGREWIHVFGWLHPLLVHLSLSQHCQSALPQYKIKSYLKRRGKAVLMKVKWQKKSFLNYYTSVKIYSRNFTWSEKRKHWKLLLF